MSRNVLIFRNDLKLTQRELADAANVSQRMIWEVESKQKNLSLEQVTALAKALGKTELQLLTPLVSAT